MSITRTRATLVVGGLFLAGLLAGAWTGAAAADRATDPYAGLDLFARVLTLVEDKYVDEMDHDKLVNAAVEGIMDELDPHSRWLDEDEYRQFKDDTTGNYEGIGVEVRRVPEGVLVARVLPGGPAERDGLKADDRIVAVDGESRSGLDLETISKKLKGPRGTPVVLSITREGWSEPHEVPTVRDRIHTPSVMGERVEDVAYIRLIQFQDDCARDLEREFDELEREAPLQGLILDLRDNPGGLLDQAVAISDLFLDDGVIVSTRSRVEGETSYEATTGGISTALPLVVLINGMSASASEIVAGALQDTGRAQLVGTRSYGKGSVQTLFENRDDTAVKLTVGRYYTPSGEPVADRNGRQPDHVVVYPTESTAYDKLMDGIAALEVSPEQRDDLLQLAGDLPKPQEPDVVIDWDLPASARTETDPQLAKALYLLTTQK